MRKILNIALISLLLTLFVNADEKPAEKLLGKYTGIKSFSTDFERVFTQRITGKKTRDNGKITYMAPDNIKMDTFFEGKLSEQTFVNGETTTFIYHTKKNVLIKKSAGEAGEYLAFLKGLEEVRKNFAIQDSTDSIDKARKTGIEIKEGAKLFKLTPVQPVANLRYIFLTSLNDEVSSVIIIDQLRNINQFKFKNTKNNPSVDSKIFKVSYPADYEVSNF
jgi:outer membrane lipoprotein-sorting protein